MSSRVVMRALVVPLLVFMTQPAAADGWSSFVLAGDRSDNSTLLLLLSEVDLDQQVEICMSLGVREDPYVGDVLLALAFGAQARTRVESEYLLRVLLDALLREPRSATESPGAVGANEEALRTIAQAMADLRDPALEGLLLQTLPMLDMDNKGQLLMAAGARIVVSLRENGGYLDPAQHSRAMAFLDAVAAMPMAAFAGPCMEIARYSRERSVVEKARAAFLSLPRDS